MGEKDAPRNAEDLKGRAKEALGNLTGDEELEREGKLDQASAKVKDAAEKVKDGVEDAVDNIKDKLTRD